MKDIWIIHGPIQDRASGLANAPVRVKLLREEPPEVHLIQEQSWGDFYGSAELLSSLCLPDTEICLQMDTEVLGADTPPGDFWVGTCDEEALWMGAPFCHWHGEALALLAALKVKPTVLGSTAQSSSPSDSKNPQRATLSHVTKQESRLLFSGLRRRFLAPDWRFILRLSLQADPHAVRLRRTLLTGFAGLLVLLGWFLPTRLEQQKLKLLDEVLQAPVQQSLPIIQNHSLIQELLGRFGKNDRANLNQAQWLWTASGQSFLLVSLTKPRKKLPKGCKALEETRALCELSLSANEP